MLRRFTNKYPISQKIWHMRRQWQPGSLSPPRPAPLESLGTRLHFCVVECAAAKILFDAHPPPRLLTTLTEWSRVHAVL